MTPSRLLAELVTECAGALDIAGLMSRALPLVLDLTGAVSAHVLRTAGDDVRSVAHRGAELPVAALPHSIREVTPGWRGLGVVDAWRERGVRTTTAFRLAAPPEALVLVLAFDADPSEGPPDGDLLDVVGPLLQTAVGRAHSDAALVDMAHRVDNAQMLANMGDYDWHIASDTNRWSDQLYRIYGHEPQSFNASYERFVSHIHPEDRERITGIHQQAYATGEPYRMVERVQRPDGEIRYLSSNGQVVLDADGTPVRMRGTCIDITGLVLAEQEVERARARFEALVESSGDAILVLEDGLVVQTNDRGRALLGGDPVGLSLDRFVRVEGPEKLGVRARGLAGGELTLDVFAGELNPGVDDDLVAVFLRDAGPRLASESLAVNLREAQVRRQQAVEINDNILQSLTASVYCLEDSDTAAAARYIQLTLASARDMMHDLLEPVDGADLKPGDLVRRGAVDLRAAPTTAKPGPSRVTLTSAGPPDRRVLIVDDCEDMRALLRLFLEQRDRIEVVGAASSGDEGMRLAAELQPDLVLLDLAMPGMDGLEALPHILDGAPSASVIVLSGFDHRVGAQAMALGADRFVQKGGGFKELMHVIDEVLPGGTPPHSAAS
ncbi:response regulator [Nocardioides sp.]|uniref:response regulator n=1 Tax=Nocardioides sp. TaxID=35761 RepID=UPI002B272284|nr:response regulator [Nocardioides sp.]